VAAHAAFGSLAAARTSSRPSRQLERSTRFSARSAGEGACVAGGAAVGGGATGGALAGSTVTVGGGVAGGGGEGAGATSAAETRATEQRTSAITGTMALVIAPMIQALPRSPAFVVASPP